MLKKISILILFFLQVYTSWSQDAIIPMPIEINYGNDKLNLKNGIQLQIDPTIGSIEKNLAEQIFYKRSIRLSSKFNGPKFTVQIDSTIKLLHSQEGYLLSINKEGIALKAKSDEGVFYGLQTLDQFSFTNKSISYAEIKDEPAFSTRGFLVDVGRNYQPLSMLKEQVDMMAKYKLNVLHFHFTEDIAWRLESLKHPKLTDADNMTRWKGKYYTLQEFRELIDYCKERHILFLPEIDMPGHSAAFERYFGFNMQSENGINAIKELLKEFRDNFPDLEHLHIGGDEVKITNKGFMPEITNYVEDLGFKTYGWYPGSNLKASTIRQMWMGAPKVIDASDSLKYIDSKHLYLNHMDPLETVTTLYFRKIAEQDKESEKLSGAILCSWPDRAVANPEDMFLQNAIYPGMITFAERIWKGNGESGWKANIPEKNSTQFNAFVEFENRLLNHKAKYFMNLPFPYQKQTSMVWELLKPYDNKGDPSKSFDAEHNPYSKDLKVYKEMVGGTVILRHWWADIIPGAIDSPKTNQTIYARTKIWSEKDELQSFWIGFGNLSRSYASDSPQVGEWDDLGSQVFVNGKTIQAPEWKQAGQKGDLEKPLIDEGYSFRDPSKIQLKRGWNEVLIKLPVRDFTGKDWQNPVKWMFTFIPYQ